LTRLVGPIFGSEAGGLGSSHDVGLSTNITKFRQNGRRYSSAIFTYSATQFLIKKPNYLDFPLRFAHDSWSTGLWLKTLFSVGQSWKNLAL